MVHRYQTLTAPVPNQVAAKVVQEVVPVPAPNPNLVGKNPVVEVGKQIPTDAIHMKVLAKSFIG